MRNHIVLGLIVSTIYGCSAEVEISDDGANDSTGEGDPNVTVDPNADPTPAPGDLTVLAAAASGLVDTEEAAFLDQINTYRAAHGKAALRISVALTHSAQNHSTDMANNDYFAHNSGDGTDPFTRMKNAGYTYNTSLGENIAAGAAAGADAFVQWRDACDAGTDGVCTYAHRMNMLSADFTVLGIGRAFNATSTYQWYWTTDFGGTTDALLSYGTGTILANGGFEVASLGTAVWSGVRTRGGWYVHNAARSSSVPLAGVYEMQVRDPDPGTAQVTQIVLAAPGITYTFKGSSRRISGTSAQTLYLEFLSATYVRLAVVRAASPAGATYAEASVSGAAPPGTRFVRVFAYGGSAAGVHSTFAYDSMGLGAE